MKPYKYGLTEAKKSKRDTMKIRTYTSEERIKFAEFSFVVYTWKRTLLENRVLCVVCVAVPRTLKYTSCFLVDESYEG